MMIPFGLGVLLAVFVAVRPDNQANAQGFITNCTWQTGFMTDSLLGMYCNNDNWDDFSYDWTWFDTSLCLVNNGGLLIPYESGNYFPSCKDCIVQGSDVNFILACTCFQPTGEYAPAAYDLNRVIYNENGTLGCFGHVGNKTEIGPF
ncbi:hypothetical protein F5Y15DRAFT_80405 [Xylariaceae sp. FL0016]|nr:hypothetical protein F5Y15DRAFT_80405 [Xylariaceae sp. FL0016]